MHTQFFVTFFLNFSSIDIYYFVDVAMHVGEVPPQQDEEMDKVDELFLV